MRALIAFACLMLFASPAAAQDYARQTAAAADLQRLCREDAGRLWSASLCGPLIVVDPISRQAWATQRDNGGVLSLTSSGGWVGALPTGVPIANTTVNWGGVRWIMIVGPLPEDASARRVLVMHEAWHRLQQSLGLPMSNVNAAHLETERGRYLMRLELRALATAMLSSGRARRNAARDALAFRLARLASFADARAQEAALDRNEGLASYTGVKLGAGDDAHLFAARTLNDYDRHEAFARAYAYASGPAYGLLLDEYAQGWRQNLATLAPADLLIGPLQAEVLTTRRLQRRAERFGGAQIAAEERERERAHRQLIATLRARFAEGPRLELPLGNAQFEFDPERVTPIPGLGSVYRSLVLRDRWGELRASDGALISEGFVSATVSAPAAGGVHGPGWSLTLAPGYRVSAPDSAGVMRTEAVPPPAAGH
ncbi:MAG: hypothetical protein AB7T59_01020 [Hyphomonadaceae bacterium]